MKRQEPPSCAIREVRVHHVLRGAAQSATARSHVLEAETVIIGIEQPADKGACGTSQTDFFSSGSHINVAARPRLQRVPLRLLRHLQYEELTAPKADPV
jgi:hypothetical protein